MASWRVPGSILKATGLDFIGSGLDFQLAGLVLEGCQRSPKLQRSWPESPRSGQATGCLPSIAEPLLPVQIMPRSSEGGGAAVVPPQGASIRRPPKVCQQRVKHKSNWLCPITAGQSRHSFEQFVRAIRSEVFFPLSFPFPRSLGTTANPTPKSGKVWFFRIFSRFFRLPNRA